MKKNIVSKVIILSSVLIVFFLSYNFVIGSQLGVGFNQSIIPSGTLDSELKGVGDRIKAILITFFQVASLIGIIGAGIKYMYSPASKKAEIKTGMIGIAIGCIIVFSTATIIGFATDVFSDIYRNSI